MVDNKGLRELTKNVYNESIIDLYSLGEFRHYPIGSVVVWGGQDPCIGIISVNPDYAYQEEEFFYIDHEHNSLNYRNLRLASMSERTFLLQSYVIKVSYSSYIRSRFV